MNNVKQLVKEIHTNAVNHGWWENNRPLCEILALIHSELSEALEEFRNGHGLNRTYYSWHKCERTCKDINMSEFACASYPNCGGMIGKPEGIPAELADTIIRIFDYFGYEGYYPEEILYHNMDEIDNLHTFPQLITEAHAKISMAYLAASKEEALEKLHDCVNFIFGYCAQNGINLEAAIIKKHEYNLSRPYKHGGKVI